MNKPTTINLIRTIALTGLVTTCLFCAGHTYYNVVKSNANTKIAKTQVERFDLIIEHLDKIIKKNDKKIKENDKLLNRNHVYACPDCGSKNTYYMYSVTTCMMPPSANTKTDIYTCSDCRNDFAPIKNKEEQAEGEISDLNLQWAPNKLLITPAKGMSSLECEVIFE